MKYSIVIPTFRHLDDALRPCLDSMCRYTNNMDPNKEFIIVSNGCNQDVYDYLEFMQPRFLNLKILKYSEPLGYTVSTNIGIKESKGEFVVLFNNDNILLDQNIDNWIDMLNSPFFNEKVGVTGCHSLRCPNTNRDFILFFCAMIRRSMFDRVGYLDEIFNPGAGEDTDFCHKVENSGYLVKCITKPILQGDFYTGYFPIYHKAEVTVKDNVWWNWDEIFARNSKILKERYNKGEL